MSFACTKLHLDTIYRSKDMMILVNCGCCGVASGYGCAVCSTYGATGVQGTHSCTVRGGATYDMTMMKISAIIILSSSTEILFEIKTRCIFTPLKWNIKSPAKYPTNSNRVRGGRVFLSTTVIQSCN